jgi:Phosphotransferase enzyme family
MGRPSRTAGLVTFRALAFLLSPAEPGIECRIVETDRGWSFDREEAEASDLLLWGGPALPSGTDRGTALRAAMARDRGIRSLRRHPPTGLTLAGVHRLPPARLEPGSLRNMVRDAALGGAILELARDPRPTRVIDTVARAAGAPEPVGQFRPGSGGAALVMLGSGPDRMVLRLAQTGTPGDPTHAAEGLALLAGRDLAVPRVIGRGQVAGASWSAEGFVSGSRPRKVTPELAAAAARFCVALPRSDGPPSSVEEDLTVIARTFAAWKEEILEITRHVLEAVAPLPTVTRHGDLWAGNLLVEGQSLSGVIDWDAWHPSGVAGTDLLHLVATEERRRAGRGLGAHWLQRPWRSEAFQSVGKEYWRGLGVTPDREALDGVGVAWWATQVANSLLRLPDLAEDRRWVRENVEAVLAVLGR